MVCEKSAVVKFEVSNDACIHGLNVSCRVGRKMFHRDVCQFHVTVTVERSIVQEHHAISFVISSVHASRGVYLPIGMGMASRMGLPNKIHAGEALVSEAIVFLYISMASGTCQHRAILTTSWF